MIEHGFENYHSSNRRKVFGNVLVVDTVLFSDKMGKG